MCVLSILFQSLPVSTREEKKRLWNQWHLSVQDWHRATDDNVLSTFQSRRHQDDDRSDWRKKIFSFILRPISVCIFVYCPFFLMNFLLVFLAGIEISLWFYYDFICLSSIHWLLMLIRMCLVVFRCLMTVFSLLYQGREKKTGFYSHCQTSKHVIETQIKCCVPPTPVPINRSSIWIKMSKRFLIRQTGEPELMLGDSFNEQALSFFVLYSNGLFV